MKKCDHAFSPFDAHHTMCGMCGEIRYVPTEVERQLIDRILDLEQQIEQHIEQQGESAELAPGQSLDEHIDKIERLFIERALEKARYNKTRAAALLGVSFRSFRYKLKKHGLD